MKAPDTMRRPYTVPWLREAIEGLGKRYSMPSEPTLWMLAKRLNVGAEIYADREVLCAARARAAEVHHALQVLQHWHDDRAKELDAANIPPEIVKRETQLRDKFNAYMKAMASPAPEFVPGLSQCPFSPWMSGWCGRSSKTGATSRCSLPTCSCWP